MNTFYSFRDDTIPILELGLSQDRYFDALYGKIIPRSNVLYDLTGVLRPVDHFGYLSRNSLSSSYKKPRYFILNNQGRNYYPAIFPEFQDKWKFTPEDFNRLESDNGVEKVYNNQNLDVFYIVPFD